MCINTKTNSSLTNLSRIIESDKVSQHRRRRAERSFESLTTRSASWTCKWNNLTQYIPSYKLGIVKQSLGVAGRPIYLAYTNYVRAWIKLTNSERRWIRMAVYPLYLQYISRGKNQRKYSHIDRTVYNSPNPVPPLIEGTALPAYGTREIDSLIAVSLQGGSNVVTDAVTNLVTILQYTLNVTVDYDIYTDFALEVIRNV